MSNTFSCGWCRKSFEHYEDYEKHECVHVVKAVKNEDVLQ
jgi:hypothetical protein